jgi:nucleotide-binding universal stress UspA family protein
LIKDILVAASGDEQDEVIFATAFAFARSLQAHLDFCHLRMTPDLAMTWSPYFEMAQGYAVEEALDQLQRNAERQSMSARKLTLNFCGRNNIPITNPNSKVDRVSANYSEERDDVLSRFVFLARHHDLIVIGRSDYYQLLITELLFSSGRPIVVAPVLTPKTPIKVAMVGWKETPEAVHALSGAMPILLGCSRVVLTCVGNDELPRHRELDSVSTLLLRHGVASETMVVVDKGRSVADTLHAAAQVVHADLLVVGAYGHSWIRELIFGGVTGKLLGGASLPILLAH